MSQRSFDGPLAGYILATASVAGKHWHIGRLFILLSCFITIKTKYSTRSSNILNKDSIRLGIFLIVLTAFEALLTLWPGRILLMALEGDVLHAIDAAMRMSMGQIPHLDFMTPIGILGFAPMAWFLKLGAGAGQAMVLANLLMTAVLIPALWWIGTTKMTIKMGWIFGGMIVVLTTAMVHGNGAVSTSFSVFYNRWSWSIALVVLVVLLFPSRFPKSSKWVDPLIVGLGLSMLAFIKMTFFLPLVVAFFFILLSARRYGFILRCVLTGAVIAILVTGFMGVDFVVAYAQDLLAVTAQDSVRSYPSLTMSGVLFDPSNIAATLLLFTSIIFFRKIGRQRQGLALLVLSPAFLYIAFQNWDNDPKWLFFLMFYLAAFLPKEKSKPFMGMPARQVGIVLSAVTFAVSVPSLTSLLASTQRVFFAGFDGAVKIPLPEGKDDLWMFDQRVLVSYQTVVLVDETDSNSGPNSDPMPEINGAPLGRCEISGGFIALTNAVARELDTMPALKDKQVLFADVLNVGWLMGDLPPVKGAAVWYYGGESGFANADYFLVPVCPLRPSARETMVINMVNTGWELQPVPSSNLMRLYKIVR